MTTTQRRYYIALVDYLPSGCEALNIKLNGGLTDDTNSSSYVMRATCAGTFIIPAAKAEEMYSPENFGRGTTEKVIID
ncbi:unnamed protein product [Rotaria sp. Silwood1]|nr:unnamed protein product [Rotaria sp. Silwood1]CAF1647584.1 unnamed protein product [Rotaria sp. Silwood1]